MNTITTIELTCASAHAEQFLMIGFELIGQRTDGCVSLVHRRARREHIFALVAFAKAGMPFVGQDEGRTSAEPYVFAAAAGEIVCASLADCFADGGARAAAYADHRDRSEELMADWSADRVPAWPVPFGAVANPFVTVAEA